MDLLPATQMGEDHDVGPRDEQGQPHGLWQWLKDMRYLENAAAEPFLTQMSMSVYYDHGVITTARMDYDITKQHTQSWEEGRAISSPEHWVKSMNNMPFKLGLWRGEDKDREKFVRMYGEQCILWEYNHKGFRRVILDEGGFFKEWEGFTMVRPPPHREEWPLEWDPYLKNIKLQTIWRPPVDR